MQQSNPKLLDAETQHTKSKRARPYHIEYRATHWLTKEWGDWALWQRKGYRTAQERDDALDNLIRKYAAMRYCCYEFRAKD